MTVVVGTGIQFFGGTELDSFDWDTLILAGDVWPGVATVEGKGATRKLDIKRTKGSDGATMKDEGANPAEFTAKLLVYNSQDWEEVQRLLPTVQPRRAGGPRAPVTIFHPYPQLLGVDKVYIKAVRTDLDKGKGFLTVTLELIEWFPAPKPVKKGAGTAGGAGTDKKDEINTITTGGTLGQPTQPNYSPVQQAEEGLADAVGDVGNQVLADLCNTYPETC